MKDPRKLLSAIGVALLVTGLLMSVAPSVWSATLDWEFYDFFNVPPGEYWDARAATYGETPIGAECFTASAISNGLCFPSDPSVPDVASYPYTIWTYTGETVSRRTITAPYRIRATGVDIPGYDLTRRCSSQC